MNTEHFKKILLAKEQELTVEIARYEQEGRESTTGEVEDATDAAVSDEDKSTAFELGTGASAKLAQVRDALQRIKDGTYGVCIDCGRPIGEARLEAVPWTPYCIEDQEKHDRESAESSNLPEL